MSQRHRLKRTRHGRRPKPRPATGPDGTSAVVTIAEASDSTPAASPARSPARSGNRNAGRRGRADTRGDNRSRHQSGAKYGEGNTRPRQRWFYDVRQYAILQDDTGAVLVLQLPADYDTGTANTWTLPGGKLEPADEPLSGIRREITEETGLPGVGPLLPASVARWSTRNSKKLAIFYRARIIGTNPKPNLSHEHQRAVWAKPEELASFPFHRPEMRDTLLEILQLQTEAGAET